MIGTSGASVLAAAGSRQPSHVARPRTTSPSQNRVRSFCQSPSGRIGAHRHRTRRIATGCRLCDYETASGRWQWLNRDPAGTVDGPNLYAFVGNSPLNAVDPWGEVASFDVQKPLQLGGAIVIPVIANVKIYWACQRCDGLKATAHEMNTSAAATWSKIFATSHLLPGRRPLRVYVAFKVKVEERFATASDLGLPDDREFADWNFVLPPIRGGEDIVRSAANVDRFQVMTLYEPFLKADETEQKRVFAHEFGHLLRHRDAYASEPFPEGWQQKYGKSFEGWAENLMSNDEGRQLKWENFAELVMQNRALRENPVLRPFFPGSSYRYGLQRWYWAPPWQEP